MYKRYIKRYFDISISIIVLLLSMPILLPTCILLYLANEGKVFFTQQRPGLNGKIFRIYKLKTMTDKTDASGKLLPDKDRIHKVGAFVRGFSIDELPQLYNVFMGDMSLIGPRPLLVQYLTLYNEHQKRRHEVRPGITGWAQVNGRNKISWEMKFALDVWYVDNLSLFLDIKILYLTVKKVFSNKDVNQSNDRPMQTFIGSN